VQRELVCLLLPTSSVNNNNNTCDFIYISQEIKKTWEGGQEINKMEVGG
jgi:hypothetical protein